MERYDPETIELKWQDAWERERAFYAPNPAPGEMDAEQLAETTMDPRHRMLRKVNIENAQQAEATFDLLMGSDVAPRKDFIIAGASSLDRERIDA